MRVAYECDLTPLDYHLFTLLEYALSEHHFDLYEDLNFCCMYGSYSMSTLCMYISIARGVEPLRVSHILWSKSRLKERLCSPEERKPTIYL